MIEGKAADLRHDGYCVIEGLLALDMLARVQALAASCVAAIDREHRDRYRSEGSLVPVADHPAFADLIAYPPALAALRGLGLEDARFSSGYVISKPPKSPALFWHQDWWGWDHPLSTTDEIVQVFAFYYLSPTTKENGCLRVIPGSHRRRHPLHDAIDAHADDVAQVRNPEDRAFRPAEDEVAVPVNPGDLVVGDARLLHGSYPNVSDAERTLITLWYHPGFARQPASLQARVHEIYRRIGVDTDPAAGDSLYPGLWPETERRKVEALLPIPVSAASPQPWNRKPVGLR